MVRMPPDMADRTPYQHILYEKDPEDSRLVRITLNRPETLNALSYNLLMDLRHALVTAERDPDVKVVIIKGAGRIFSAGYDLEAYYEFEEGLSPIVVKKDHISYYHQDVWFTIWNLQKPVIAQVHGYALAGGSELAMICDMTIMAEDAVTGYPPHRAIGATGDICYWPWLCGLKKGKYLAMSGDPITGKEAAEIGLATMAVPVDKLEETATLVAKRLAMIPSELLFLNKYACNKSMEIMGMRVGIEIAGLLHDYAQTFDASREFGRISKEKGLNYALEWRDAKFGNDFRSLKKMASEKGVNIRFPQALSMPEVKQALEKFEAERKKQAKQK
ncbi:MAG: enoyl-CoA hydratase/isomerase family protein [Chloroflexi bacterium]|nr:enoyl-CoA hydratase/isomerase family protein [Chloroflexota bacterium]